MTSRSWHDEAQFTLDCYWWGELFVITSLWLSDWSVDSNDTSAKFVGAYYK